jgi:hypothetical protein
VLWHICYSTIFLEAVLKDIIVFMQPLIGVEGAKTPAGVRGWGDPAGASAEETPRNARGKRCFLNGNQRPNLTQPFWEKSTPLCKNNYPKNL